MPVNQANHRNRPEIVIPMTDKEKAEALVDMMRRQVEVMGYEEQREMLAFMRGVSFGRAVRGA